YDVAPRAAQHRIERIAGHERETRARRSAVVGIEPRCIGAYDARLDHAKRTAPPVAGLDHDTVTVLDVAQITELRVSMRGHNRRASRADRRRVGHVAGPEGHRLAVR